MLKDPSSTSTRVPETALRVLSWLRWAFVVPDPPQIADTHRPLSRERNGGFLLCYAQVVFGLIPECRSASLRNKVFSFTDPQLW